jgi:uncharacterized coiled-coil protein SlyX
MEKDIKVQKLFNLKDVITIVIFVFGIAGTWFSLQSRINVLEVKVSEQDKILKDNNLELIVYKLDGLIVTVDKLVAKLDKD